MRRKSFSRSRSKRVFRRSSGVHKKNTRSVMRGGLRL